MARWPSVAPKSPDDVAFGDIVPLSSQASVSYASPRTDEQKPCAQAGVRDGVGLWEARASVQSLRRYVVMPLPLSITNGKKW